jgi:hypothetical protein
MLLPNDGGFLGGSLVRTSVEQALAQLNQSRPLDHRRASRHRRAGHRIEHPGRHQHDDPVRTANPHIAAIRVLLDLANLNLAPSMGMPAVANFQLLPDMGRMNGE